MCLPCRQHQEQFTEQPRPSSYHLHFFSLGRSPTNLLQLLYLLPSLILILISTSISNQQKCNCWMTIAGLCGDVIFMMCDAFLLYYIPLMTPLIKRNLFCTNIACFLHCVGNFAWCVQSDWIDPSEDLSSSLHLFFMIPYAAKMYLFLPVLKGFGTELSAIMLVQMPDEVLFFPLSIILRTSKPVRYFNAETANLFILTKIVQVLENAFLKNNSEGFHCDDDIDMMAKYLITKRRLQQCEADNEQLSKELDQLKKTHQNAAHKAKKTAVDLRKQLKKQQGNANCCICQDKTKNILLRPCNHLAVCEYCVEEILTRRDKGCPLCREKIEDHIKVFL